MSHDPSARHDRFPHLSLRIQLSPEVRLGPGKVRLLEQVRETGSISAAARAMNMSYRRAWLLVDGLNRGFRQPAVATQHGGRRGGGARLTAFGEELIARYQRLQSAAERATAAELAALVRATNPIDDPAHSRTADDFPDRRRPVPENAVPVCRTASSTRYR